MPASACAYSLQLRPMALDRPGGVRIGLVIHQHPRAALDEAAVDHALQELRARLRLAAVGERPFAVQPLCSEHRTPSGEANSRTSRCGLTAASSFSLTTPFPAALSAGGRSPPRGRGSPAARPNRACASCGGTRCQFCAPVICCSSMKRGRRSAARPAGVRPSCAARFSSRNTALDGRFVARRFWPSTLKFIRRVIASSFRRGSQLGQQTQHHVFRAPGQFARRAADMGKHAPRGSLPAERLLPGWSGPSPGFDQRGRDHIKAGVHLRNVRAFHSSGGLSPATLLYQNQPLLRARQRDVEHAHLPSASCSLLRLDANRAAQQRVAFAVHLRIHARQTHAQLRIHQHPRAQGLPAHPPPQRQHKDDRKFKALCSCASS